MLASPASIIASWRVAETSMQIVKVHGTMMDYVSCLGRNCPLLDMISAIQLDVQLLYPKDCVYTLVIVGELTTKAINGGGGTIPNRRALQLRHEHEGPRYIGHKITIKMDLAKALTLNNLFFIFSTARTSSGYDWNIKCSDSWPPTQDGDQEYPYVCASGSYSPQPMFICVMAAAFLAMITAIINT